MKKLIIVSVATLFLVFLITPVFAQDGDGDGILDTEDNCPDTYNPNQDNYDEDQMGNSCDNCWYVSNPGQEDTYGLSCLSITMPYLEDPICGDLCDCYQEGERFLWGSDFSCCDGLVNANCCWPNEPIGRPDSCPCQISCRSCVKCGDGICGIGENWCVCRSDCPKPEEIPCTEDNQCGQDSCQQGQNICHELSFTCMDGACLSPSEEIYVNYSCNAYYGDPTYPSNKCIDSCSDDICHWPETRFWCPADCDCEDTDSDYICDEKDNCPGMANSSYIGTCLSGTNMGNTCTVPGEDLLECGTGGLCSMNQEDADGDCIGDVCDEFPNIVDPGKPDSDADGLSDDCDNCPSIPNQDQLDSTPHKATG